MLRSLKTLLMIGVALLTVLPARAFALPGARGNPVPVALALTVADAGVLYQNKEPMVSVRLDARSTRDLRNFTRVHVGQHIDVMVDSQVMWTPVIKEPILSGAFAFGAGNTREATEIARRLKAQQATLTVRLHDFEPPKYP